MLDILSYTAADLAPTKTYRRRRLLFIPADREHPEWDRRLGNLSIVVQHAADGWGKSDEVDHYAVEETDAKPGLMGRVFLLVNLSDPSQEQPYEVVVGAQSSCTCRAQKCRVPSGCKHVDALRYLVDEDILEDETPDWQRSGRWIESGG